MHNFFCHIFSTIPSSFLLVPRNTYKKFLRACMHMPVHSGDDGERPSLLGIQQAVDWPI